eukprot:3721451-Rhodomonas_salina.2
MIVGACSGLRLSGDGARPRRLSRGRARPRLARSSQAAPTRPAADSRASAAPSTQAAALSRRCPSRILRWKWRILVGCRRRRRPWRSLLASTGCECQ